MTLNPTYVTYQGKRLWLEDGDPQHLEYQVGQVGRRPLLVFDPKLPAREPVERKEPEHGERQQHDSE